MKTSCLEMPVKTKNMFDAFPFHQAERNAIRERDRLVGIFAHETQSILPFRRSGIQPAENPAIQ